MRFIKIKANLCKLVQQLICSDSSLVENLNENVWELRTGLRVAASFQ